MQGGSAARNRACQPTQGGAPVSGFRRIGSLVDVLFAPEPRQFAPGRHGPHDEIGPSTNCISSMRVSCLNWKWLTRAVVCIGTQGTFALLSGHPMSNEVGAGGYHVESPHGIGRFFVLATLGGRVRPWPGVGVWHRSLWGQRASQESGVVDRGLHPQLGLLSSSGRPSRPAFLRSHDGPQRYGSGLGKPAARRSNRGGCSAGRAGMAGPHRERGGGTRRGGYGWVGPLYWPLASTLSTTTPPIWGDEIGLWTTLSDIMPRSGALWP